MSTWRFLTLIAVLILFGLSIRWSLIDNSPPAWDQGLYLFQSATLHNTLTHEGFGHFFTAIFNFDRGRAPLLPIIVQPAFYLFGPSLDAAVISLNFFWFILAWAIAGIARDIVGQNKNGDKAGFFAFVLFALYPLTTMLSHNFLVEFPLIAFISASIYSLWLTHKTENKKWSIVCGIFVGLGLLTKVTFPAFVLPAFIFIVYRNIRKTSFWKTIALFLPAAIIFSIIAGPYYLYNFRQIIGATITLSSHSLSQLYGFGGATDIHVVLEYINSVLYTPIMLISLFCVLIMIFLKVSGFLKKGVLEKNNYFSASLITILLLWFAIPFLVAAFGEIKDPRYIYPSLIPIFVFAGVAISRFFQSKPAFILVSFFCIFPFFGYLYSNNLFSTKIVSHLRSTYPKDASLVFNNNSIPDSKDWKTNELVCRIAQNLGAQEENKNIFFLGGNRYYHLSLMNFESLLNDFHFTYLALPYYASPSMSLDEAMRYITNISPDGILYKSGKSWPEFSSRLDPEIISQLETDQKYKSVDLGIEQPDGSRFTLFIDLSKKITPISSEDEIIGNWKAGDGIAKIAPNGEDTLVLTDERGGQGYAKIQNGIIVSSDWRVTGKLTEDHQYIRWSNGFFWKK
jgi:hypothetical protein